MRKAESFPLQKKTLWWEEKKLSEAISIDEFGLLLLAVESNRMRKNFQTIHWKAENKTARKSHQLI